MLQGITTEVLIGIAAVSKAVWHENSVSPLDLNCQIRNSIGSLGFQKKPFTSLSRHPENEQRN